MQSYNDYRQHREMLANIVKRSRYFIVYSVYRDGSPEAIGNQIEVAFRYYEGSAAGAVMLGQMP